MQLNTLIKIGSLAFNVAQDEKVQELFTMLHHGAKRRGLFAPDAPWGQAGQPGSLPQAVSQSKQNPKPIVNHPVPFAPKQANQPSMPAGFDVNKYLTMDNAKKVLNWAGTVSSLLTK